MTTLWEQAHADPGDTTTSVIRRDWLAFGPQVVLACRVLATFSSFFSSFAFPLTPKPERCRGGWRKSKQDEPHVVWGPCSHSFVCFFLGVVFLCFFVFFFFVCFFCFFF